MLTNWAHACKQYRLSNGLVQKALAARLGVDTTTVSRWERGRDRPTIALQRKLRDLMYKPAERELAKLIHNVRDLAQCAVALYRVDDITTLALSQVAKQLHPNFVPLLGKPLIEYCTPIRAQLQREVANKAQRGEVVSTRLATHKVFSVPAQFEGRPCVVLTSYHVVNGDVYGIARGAPALSDQELMAGREHFQITYLDTLVD